MILKDLETVTLNCIEHNQQVHHTSLLRNFVSKRGISSAPYNQITYYQWSVLIRMWVYNVGGRVMVRDLETSMNDMFPRMSDSSHTPLHNFKSNIVNQTFAFECTSNTPEIYDCVLCHRWRDEKHRLWYVSHFCRLHWVSMGMIAVGWLRTIVSECTCMQRYVCCRAKRKGRLSTSVLSTK